MKSLHQFFTLFKKHILLRRRQPSLLLLEILWPILVFAIVAVIRSGIPPFKIGKCDYPTRAMPSSGIVPFMQNFVCNLNNRCETKDISQKVIVAEERLKRMASQIAPLVSSGSSVKSLKNLEKIIDAIDDMKGQDIEEVLENGLSLRDIFKDPDKMQKTFVEELHIFDQHAAKALFDSKIKIKEILSLTGYIDLKEIACNSTLLNSYIIFPEGTNISGVSAAICAINSSLIPNITETVQHHLNMINILKKASSLMKPYSWYEGLADFIHMIDTFFKLPTFQSSVKNIKGLGNIAKIIRKLPRWFGELQEFDVTDFKNTEDLLKTMDPFLQSIASNETLKSWQFFKDSLYWSERFFDATNKEVKFSLDSIPISLKNLFDNSSELTRFLLEDLVLPSGVVEEIKDKQIIVAKLMDVVSLQNKTDPEEFLCQHPGLDYFISNPTVLFNSLNSGIQLQTVQHIMCTNFTQVHKEFFNNNINISAKNVRQKILYHMVSEFQFDINKIIKKFKEIPPEVATALNVVAYAEFGEISKLLSALNESSVDDNLVKISGYMIQQVKRNYANHNEILNSTKDILNVVDSALKYVKVLPNTVQMLDKYGTGLQKLNSLNPNIAKTLVQGATHFENLKNQFFNIIPLQRQKRDTRGLDKSIEEQLSTELKSIYGSIVDIQKSGIDDWSNVLSNLQNPDVLNMVNDYGLIKSVVDNVPAVGAQIENSSLWIYLGPIMKLLHMTLETVNSIISESPGTSYEKLLVFSLKYGNDIIQSSLFLAENSKIEIMLQNSSMSYEMLCSKGGVLNTLYKSSGESSYGSLKTVACDLNFTHSLLKINSLVQSISEFESMQSKRISLDWKDFSSDLNEFLQNAIKFMNSNDINKNQGKMDTGVQKFVKILSSEIDYIIDTLVKQMIDNTPKEKDKKNIQILNTIVHFLNKELKSLLDKGEIFLMDYVNSLEVLKLLTTVDYSDKLFTAVFEWIQNFINDPQKMVMFWNKNLDNICNQNVYSKILSSKESVSHSVLCDEFFSKTNVTKLFQDLLKHTEPYVSLNTELSKIINNGTTANIERHVFIKNLQKLSNTMKTLIQKPPIISFGSNNLTVWNKQLKNVWNSFFMSINKEILSHEFK
ncbi:hypothetical protein Ahia01_000186400, partial [Argonauta hians]